MPGWRHDWLEFRSEKKTTRVSLCESCLAVVRQTYNLVILRACDITVVQGLNEMSLQDGDGI